MVRDCLVFTTAIAARWFEHVWSNSVIFNWTDPKSLEHIFSGSSHQLKHQLTSWPQALLGMEKILDMEPPDDLHRNPSLDVEPGQRICEANVETKRWQSKVGSYDSLHTCWGFPKRWTLQIFGYGEGMRSISCNEQIWICLLHLFQGKLQNWIHDFTQMAF